MAERKDYLRSEYYWYFEDVLRVIRGYPHINFRYIVAPTDVLPNEFFPITSTKEAI